MTESLIGVRSEAGIIALDDGRVPRQDREPREVEVQARVMAHALARGPRYSSARRARGRGMTCQGEANSIHYSAV